MFPRLMTVAERDTLAGYDTLVANLNGMRQALDTQQRALDDAHRQLDSQREQMKKLQQEYAQLEGRRTVSASGGNDAALQDVFRRLQTAAVQLPTLRSALAAGAQLSAADVLGVVAPLEVMLRDLGFEPIGEANQTVAFDPVLHQATGTQGAAPVSGESVRIRYVGYRYKGQILCRAEVTRLEQVESA